MKSLAILSPVETDLVNIGVLFGVVALVSFFALIYFYKIQHRSKRRKRKHRHSHHHSQPTLADRGGLPPTRGTADKAGPPPSA